MNSAFFDFRGPAYFKSFFQTYVNGAGIFMVRERPVGFGTLAFRNF
jgi:hypothetical protein